MYTRFPQLLSAPAADDELQPTSHQTSSLQGSADEVFRAWARILSRYTGYDDQVAFAGDDGRVIVSLSDGDVEMVEAGSAEPLPRDATAVYIDETKVSKTLALEVYVDLSTGRGAIHTNGYVPAKHLGQLADLFQTTVNRETSNLRLESMYLGSSVEFSVLNEQPKLCSGPSLLHELIHPTKPCDTSALEYYDAEMIPSRISYDELVARVSHLEAILRKRLPRTAKKRRVIVPLLLPQSLELYIAMIAVLRSGCAFCPLQLDAPRDRLDFILRDVEATLLVTTTLFVTKLQNIPDVEILDISKSLGPEDESSNIGLGASPIISPNDTAYIMYTSGSTGQPKGVPVSHRAVTQSLLAHESHIPRFLRFLQFASPTFDVSIFEIFFTLYRGSTLIICERSSLLDDLPSAMQKMKVDAAELTPTVAGSLLRLRNNAPELKLLLTIGEMLTPQVVAEFGGDRRKDSILWGMYGPTEAAIHCTLQPAFLADNRPGNIGFPLDTVSAFIMPQAGDDSEGSYNTNALPLGFVGELVIGGFQLADGYLNRQEQTAKAFIQTKSHGLLYRTGDKARMLVDGRIECLGRITTGQVKLRGQRIELGEVRYAVAKTLGCLDAVVSVIEDTLVAFCLANESVKAEDIIMSCRNWLPSFMIPSDIVLLQDLPRLQSGKVDVRALEAQYKENQIGRIGENNDDTSSSARLACNILTKVSGRTVLASQPLSLTGIDSLLAIRAASKLREAGFLLSAVDLLGERTMSELVQNQQLQQPESADGSSAEITHPAFAEVQQLAKESMDSQQLENIEKVFPCTPLQLAMLSETAKDREAYCNWIELQIDRQLDFQQVVDYFRCLAQVHHMLRSGFCQLDSSKTPYACVIYPGLDNSQFYEVQEFERAFSWKDTGLLRPFRVQTKPGNSQTSVLLQIHHALYDGWSIDLLIRDFQRLLQGDVLSGGLDFTHITNFYHNVDRTSALDYWQDHLSGFVPSNLPSFHGQTVKSPSVREEIYRMTVDPNEVERLADVLSLSKSVFFQAATAYILSSYLGYPDIVLGTVTSGRTISVAGIEDVFGPCLATSPLRIGFTDKEPLRDVFKRIHSLNRQLLHHAIVPLQTIKQVCDIEAGQSLWDVLFVWQESLESRLSEDAQVRVVASADKLECSITLEFEPRQNGIFSKATFRDDRISKEQAALFLQQIDLLVTRFSKQLDSTVAQVCGTLPQEVLSVSNGLPDRLSFEYGLEHVIEQHASARPDCAALIFATEVSGDTASVESLTYKQLNDRANQLAHFLSMKDLKSAELIAICMEKSLELYIAILAVLKLGLGYLPITPTTPLARIKKISDEAGISLCLSQRQVFQTLPLESVCEVLNVDTVVMTKLPTTNLETTYDGSRAAYAVFTSGSTGAPKGVVVTQENLLSNLAVLSELYPVSKDDRLLQSCSQAFDVSVFEIFFAWQEGMCLCSATNDVLFRDIEMAIRALEITHLSLTPTVAALVNPDNVPSVRFLVTAGEGVTEKVKNTWSDRGLFQGYGPSETTNICTVKPDVTREDVIRNIGPPFRNTSAFVFDPSGHNILPKGAVGELCFGGDQIFRGYLNQPALTATKIIEHAQFGRLYRSGDSGRLLSDGSILFATRLDDQVKIRGQRVELNEINHCILEMEDIVDCATVLVSKADSAPQLISFVVPSGIQSHLSERREGLLLPFTDRFIELSSMALSNVERSLPTYMLPTAIIPISKIPMTIQGKIDHRKLRDEVENLTSAQIEKLGGRQQNAQMDVREWSSQDKAILEALQQTLSSPISMSRGVSFLSLSLDSISAIAFARRMSQILDREVPVSAILRNPSIARLSQWLETSGISKASIHTKKQPLLPQSLVDRARAAAAKGNVNILQVLPCTPLQEAMLSSSSQDSNMYLNIMQFSIRGDPERLKQCWQKMFERHDLLRTTFMSTSDPAYPFLQLVRDHYELPWTIATTAQNIGWDRVPSAVDAFLVPVHLTLSQHTSGHSLRFCCHHALYDGTAMSLLLEEVQKTYHQEALSTLIDQGPFLREMILQRGVEHLDFWRTYLQDLQPHILRTGRRTQKLVSRTISNSLISLEKSCQMSSVSLLALCQTSFAKTLYSLFQTSDICFGNVVSGRSALSEHVDTLIASTFNTIPTRIRLQQHKLNIDAMRAAQRWNAACLAHQLSPLRSIQSDLGFTKTGIFSCILLLQSPEVELDSSIWHLEHEHGVMDFPLILELIPSRRKDTLDAKLHYNTSVLYDFEADQVLSHFASAFDQCIQNPEFATTNCPKLSSQFSESFARKIIKPSSSKSTNRNEEIAIPTSAVERSVCQIIAAMIGLDIAQISPQTSIHQLGIDSIGAIQLAASFRSKGYTAMTAAHVLQYPKIADLAELVDKSPHAPEKRYAQFDLGEYSNKHWPQVHEQNNLSASDVEHLWPCTPVQMGLVSRFLRDGKTYVNHVTYASSTEISLKQLHQAWERLVAEHELLRTGFVPVEDQQHPYAMIMYRSGVHELPFNTAPKSGFDIEVWRKESTKTFHDCLTKPPWAVCIEDSSDALLMHLSIFHGVYDATSLAIIMDTLDRIIGGCSAPSTVQLAPLLSSILGLSVTEDDPNNDHATFWKEVLEEANSNTFPDLTPLRVQHGSTSTAEKVLGMRTSTIENKCLTLDYSIQAIGQAAWARLLSSYLGEESVCFGVVLSGRDAVAHADRAAFPCLVTVPFGVLLTDKTNGALVRDAMHFNSTVRKHQFCRLSDIQRWVARDVLFDTIFAYQKIGTTRYDPCWEIVDEIASDEFSLSLELEPRPDGDMLIRATFKNDVISSKQAELMLDQYEAILEDMLDCPEGRASEFHSTSSNLLSITPAQEPILESPIQLLHEFVERQAARQPQKVAFEFFTTSEDGSLANRSWSYRELDDEGNRVSDLLIHHGITPRSYVGICFDKCPEASFAMLGILKAGCAYVAIDPSAPPARKSFIAQDSNLAILLTSSRQAGFLKDVRTSVTVIYLDEISDVSYPNSAATFQNLTPEDVCYCLYTSGTTGTPKGCEITHRNAVQAMRAFSKIFQGRWNETSKWLQFASFHFDVSVLEQYWSWSEGICVVSAPRDLIFEDLEAAIRMMGITHIDLTPSLASLIQPSNVPELCKGVFITGGEQLKQEILDEWGEQEVIHNGYGPTETTIGVTMFPCVPKAGKPANIGPQFANVGTYVLRPGTNKPVLRGGVGELCISGALVGKGYLNRPELTADKFPIIEPYGERIYRTGDLVRICHDNTFLFLGRIDDQVKLRGQRLEIGEINSTIRQAVSAMIDVATYVLRHPKQQRDQLVTFFVTGHTTRAEEASILKGSQGNSELVAKARTECMKRLPGYMVPTFIIPVSRMPLSTNNKTDAKKLKSLFCEMPLDELQAITAVDRISFDGTEKQIAEVLSNFCGIPLGAIRPRSNIFELGLDSISILALCSKLRKAGLANATPGVVMSNPHIDMLANALNETQDAVLQDDSIRTAREYMTSLRKKHQSQATTVFQLQYEDIEAITACTPLQEGMISGSLERVKHTPYFSTFTFDLEPNAGVKKLKQAWQAACAGMQILRTRFMQTEDGYVQVLLRKITLPFEIRDIPETSSFDAAIHDQRIKWLAANEMHFYRPLEVAFLRKGRESVMILNIFHALYDGNCLDKLLLCVHDAYHGTSALDYGPPFYDALVHGPLRPLEKAQSYWSSGMAPSVGTELDVLGQSTQSSEYFQDGDRLDACRRSLNVTHQAVVQAAWITTLAELCDAPQVQTGMVCSGRNIDFNDVEKVIGPMFNTIPLQLRINPSETWSSLIHRCHDFNVKSFPYQHTPLRDIQKWCRLSRKFFDSMFTFSIEANNSGDGLKNDVWNLRSDDNGSPFALALEVERKLDGNLRILLASTGETVNGIHIETILNRFQVHLMQAVDSPEATIFGEAVKLGVTSAVTPNEKSFPVSNGRITEPSFSWTPEAQIIRIEISQLSNVPEDDISEHVSIFELGLDSIDAIKLSARLAKQDINLPVTSLMRNATIASMIHHLSQTRSGMLMVSRTVEEFEDTLYRYLQSSGMPTTNVERILPTTPLQEAMIGTMIQSEYQQYFNHDILRLRPDIDEQQLYIAWQSVFKKTPILRTSFLSIDDPEVPGTYAQLLMRDEILPWNSIHLETTTQIDQLIEKLRLEAMESSLVDVKLRLTLIHMKNQRFLVLSLPHALYDGYSLELLHNDVREVYHTNAIEERPAWDQALDDILSSTKSSKGEEFWTGYLSKANPCLFEGNSLSSSAGEPNIVHRHELQSTVSARKLREFCKQQAITPQTFGQSCFALVLASYTKRLDPVFGSVLSGRNTEEALRLSFPMMNTVAITVSLQGSKTKFLKLFQQSTAEVLTHQHFPLRRAQQLAAGQGRQLFNSLFILQSKPDAKSTYDALYESVESSSDLEIPVCVELEIHASSVIWRIACHSQILDMPATKELLNQLELAMDHLMAEDDTQLVKQQDDQVIIGRLPPFSAKPSVPDVQGPGKKDEISVQTKHLNPITKVIRQALAQVAQLPVEEIGLDTTLYHIGLDSISAIKVCSLLKKEGIIISVSNLLRASDLESIAKTAQEARGDDTRVSHASKQIQLHSRTALQFQGQSRDQFMDETIEEILPATSGQIYMLKMWEQSRGRLFFDTFYFVLHDRHLSPKAIKHATLEWLKGRPILRTLFARSNDTAMPVLQLHVHSDFVSVHDERSTLGTRTNGTVPATGRFQTRLDAAIDERMAYFPLSVSYERQDSDTWRIGVRIHHALYDGVSLPALLDDLERLLIGTKTLPAATSITNYSSFVVGSHLSANDPGAQDFWTKYLSTIKPRQPKASEEGLDLNYKRFVKYRPHFITNAHHMLDTARRHGITLPSFFLAIYARELYETKATSVNEPEAKSGRIVIGLYIANRGHGTEGLDHFPTVNVLPLVVDTSLSVLQAAAKVQEDLITVSEGPNVAVGLWQIQEWTGITVDAVVNWVQLPSHQNEESGELSDKIRAQGKMDELVEREATDLVIPGIAQTENLSKAYLPSVDVEVALRGGALDVGIFAPTALLKPELADEILAKLKRGLCDFFKTE